jgi:hypothetical protein
VYVVDALDKDKAFPKWKSPLTARTDGKRSKRAAAANKRYGESAVKDVTDTRSPLFNMSNVKFTSLASPSSAGEGTCPHEMLIRGLLGKPFKVPIANYSPSSYGRSLGIRRSGSRQPLHNPEAEGALVLYAPPEISEHDRLKADVNKLPVPVVVDPLLSKVEKSGRTRN